MTDARAWLDQVDARTNAATDGPWEAYDDNADMEPVYSPFWCVANDAFHNPPADDDVPWIAVEIHTGIQADAEFIAHARADLPAATTALRAVLDRETAIRAIAAVHGVDPEQVDPADDGWLIDLVAKVLETAITTALEDA